MLEEKLERPRQNRRTADLRILLGQRPRRLVHRGRRQRSGLRLSHSRSLAKGLRQLASWRPARQLENVDGPLFALADAKTAR